MSYDMGILVPETVISCSVCIIFQFRYFSLYLITYLIAGKGKVLHSYRKNICGILVFEKKLYKYCLFCFVFFSTCLVLHLK